MKDALINFLKEQDNIVAVYCKVVSFGGDNDKYSVVFHQKDGDSFSINVDFTEEELTKAKRYWKFVESWYEVKQIRDIFEAYYYGKTKK